MAVKFSQFLSEALSSPSYLVGYNSTTNLNTKVSYADLVAAFTPGTGTVNYVSKWTTTSVLGDSQIFDNGTSVGIGTNTLSSNAVLTVGAYSAGTDGKITIKGRTNDNNWLGRLEFSNNSGSYLYQIYNSSNGMFFDISGTSAMLITRANRNLLIGTTTDAGYKLDVNGSLRTTSNSFFCTDLASGVGIGTTSLTGAQRLIVQTNLSIGTTTIVFFRLGNGSQSLIWNSGGELFNSGNVYLATGGATGAGSKAVGVNTTSIDASALLQIDGTTKGLLPPRMTAAQMVAITSPATGLVVYDTTNNKLTVYDGTAWVAVH